MNNNMARKIRKLRRSIGSSMMSFAEWISKAAVIIAFGKEQAKIFENQMELNIKEFNKTIPPKAP